MADFYCEKPSTFNENPIYITSLFISYVIRDCVTIIMEMILSIFLIYSIHSYHRRRLAVNVQQEQVFITSSDYRNTIISVIVSLLTVITHSVLILKLILARTNQQDSRFYINIVMYFCNFFKGLINFFLLIILNKLFRRNFLALVPKLNFIKFLFLKRPRSNSLSLQHSTMATRNNQQDPIEIVNTVTESTYL